MIRASSVPGVIVDLSALLTLWALVMNHITVAGDDRCVVIQAVIGSASALVLLAFTWKRLPWPSRLSSMIISLAAGFTLITASWRLSAIMEW